MAERLTETASQTAGPYVHIGLIPDQAGFVIYEQNFANILVTDTTEGERIEIEGQVLDGTSSPVRDALIEIWQANSHGRYNHPEDRQDKPLDPHFRGWGRSGTAFDTGLYRFHTIKPGPVGGPRGNSMAPHISFWIVARGINTGLQTRLYFADEVDANGMDPLLKRIDPPSRRQTLLAERQERDGKIVYRFDIHLQGPDETVFLDI